MQSKNNNSRGSVSSSDTSLKTQTILAQQYRSFSNNNNNNLTDNDSDLEEDNDGTWKSRPEIWSDDTRMNALFAPFRKRDLNPLHYDNKLKFWKEQISAICNEKQVVQIDLKTLEGFFVRKKIKPKCLEPVLAQMITGGVFKTRNEILQPKKGIFHTVINKCIWSPLVWSTTYILEKTAISSYMPSIQGSSNTQNTSDLNSSIVHYESQTFAKLVNCSMIETKSTEILGLLRKNVVFNNVDCVIEYDRLFDMGFDNENDSELILKYLEVNGKVIIFEAENDKKFVKFSMGSGSVAPVTEIELSYIQLKETESKLEADSNKIETEIANLTDTIKIYLKQNNRTTAIKYLKKRKQLEKSIASKEDTLSNIQAMLMSIQQADTNKLAYDAYSKSANALKEANKDINIDKLDDTMQDLQEMMQVNVEIEDAIKSPVVSGRYQFDDTELNLELAELLEGGESNGKAAGYLEKLDESMDMSAILNSLPQIPQNGTTPKKQAVQY